MKRTMSGMEAVDRAEFWLKECDGDYDEAIDCVYRYERGGYRRKKSNCRD